MPVKLMKLINSRTGEMQCRVCGTTHFATIKPLAGEVFYNREWVCKNGCRLSGRDYQQ